MDTNERKYIYNFSMNFIWGFLWGENIYFIFSKLLLAAVPIQSRLNKFDCSWYKFTEKLLLGGKY